MTQFGPPIVAIQSDLQAAVPVVQAGMVAGDEIGQDPSRRTKELLRQQSRSGRVGYSAGLALAVCILGIEAGGPVDLALEGRAVLGKVRPKSIRGRPFGPAEGLGVAPGLGGDRAQAVVV